jgi:hypothetical protein
MTDNDRDYWTSDRLTYEDELQAWRESTTRMPGDALERPVTPRNGGSETEWPPCTFNALAARPASE